MSSLMLTRFHFSDKHTSGVLTYNGKFVAWTLEDASRVLRKATDKVPNETAIPFGTYKISVSMSPRFKRKMIAIEDVPWFKGIRIHAGNDKDDTEGCILVGSTWVGGSAWIGDSRRKEVEVLELVEKQNINSITILEVR